MFALVGLVLAVISLFAAPINFYLIFVFLFLSLIFDAHLWAFAVTRRVPRVRA